VINQPQEAVAWEVVAEKVWVI
jgi:hypothetical protein